MNKEKNKRNRKICELYFCNKMTFSEIAKVVNISISQVSRIISKNSNYIAEKNQRIFENKEKHKNNTKQLIKKKQKLQTDKLSNEKAVLDFFHNQASCELSDSKHLTNENYRKWNYSAYKYNPSKRRYEFDENLGRSHDVPKYIKER